MGGDKEPASKAVSSGKSQPFSGSVSSTRLLGGRQGRAGRRVVGGKQSPPASPSGDVPGLAAGRVCPSHCGRAGTHPPPCSKAGPVVGGQGCQEGPGHSPDFKAFPRGLVVPSALSRAAAAGVADAVSSAGASGRPPEGPPGRFRGAVGVSAAAAQPERAHSGLPGPSVPQAWGPGVALWNRDWCSLPSLPSLPPPTAHQASWLWPPPIPGCVCRAPRGRQGRRRSGLRTAGARAAKYLRELSETDRHVGNLVRVGLGEAAGWAGRQEEGRWGCLPRLLNPAETTILPSPNQKVHLAPSSCLYQYSETVTLAGV